MPTPTSGWPRTRRTPSRTPGRPSSPSDSGAGSEGDAEVLAATDAMAAANHLDTYKAYYTNLTGGMLTPLGVVTTDPALAEQVGPADAGDTTIPPGAQGVSVGGSQVFGTTFARVLGITQFTASAVATAVAGALTGGVFMPVVFPVSMADCDGSGNTVVVDEPWRMSDPNPTDPTAHPLGQEYIVPLCKTDSGSFMVLDLDPNQDCDGGGHRPDRRSSSTTSRSTSPPTTATTAASRSNRRSQAAQLQGTVVMIPICDGQCETISGGSHAFYHVIRIAAFYLDYLSDSNSGEQRGLCADDLADVRHEHGQHRRRQRQLELHGRLVRPVRDVRPGRQRKPQQRRGRRSPAHPVTRRLARGLG